MDAVQSCMHIYQAFMIFYKAYMIKFSLLVIMCCFFIDFITILNFHSSRFASVSGLEHALLSSQSKDNPQHSQTGYSVGNPHYNFVCSHR